MLKEEILKQNYDNFRFLVDKEESSKKKAVRGQRRSVRISVKKNQE